MMKFDKCENYFIKVINCIVSFCNLTYRTKSRFNLGFFEGPFNIEFKGLPNII